MMLKSQLRGHKDRVWSVAWSQTGKYIASTSGDKTIRIWSQADPRSPDWSCVALLDGVHSRTVRSVAWSPDGKYLASCGFDGLICIWSYSHNDGWECTLQLEGHENEVKSVAWSVSGHLLASCSRDK
jgi:WD40 repeat protein